MTAVDASSRMLAINRACVNGPKVRYVHGEILAWVPDRTYDVVFFGFWLSNVLPSAVHNSWTLVRKCLAPHGCVAFINEDDRAAGHDDVYVISGIPVSLRSLSDGRQFEIVKFFWMLGGVENGLRSTAWDVQVRRVSETFLYGVGRPNGPGE